MKTITHLIAIMVIFPLVAFADNVGSCGWGSKLFHGQQGIAPQVLAVTTNGVSGNQTFAITLGTSGCTQTGKIRSSWKTAAYIDSNITKLARDISRGQGESLETLASLLNIEKAHKQMFTTALQQNFVRIFPSEDVNTETVIASIQGVLSEHTILSGYAALL